MDWIALTNYGTLGLCLAGLSWVVWHSIRTVYQDLIKPAVAKHLAYLDTSNAHMAEQTELMRTMVTTQGKQTEVLEGVVQTQQDHQEQIRLLLGWMERSHYNTAIRAGHPPQPVQPLPPSASA